MSTAGQYRQLARDFHFMARGLPPGENRSTLLKMAEECERLADQQEQATDLRQERSKRARRREICLTESQFPSDCTKIAKSKPSTTEAASQRTKRKSGYRHYALLKVQALFFRRLRRSPIEQFQRAT